MPLPRTTPKGASSHQVINRIPRVGEDVAEPGVRTKRVLMIAYHYPPCIGSSGQQRTLCFSRDLPAYGWQPLVLTVHRRAYPTSGEDQVGDIPATVPVTRAFALDSKRHLAIKGRHIGWLALPDSWVSWCLGAIPQGLMLIRRYRPDVLWSTYPIATAHLIGAALHRLTGIPWVADIRDPMVEVDPITGQHYPSDPRLWRLRRRIERLATHSAAKTVLVSPGSYRIYAERYPDLASDRLALIENGYDESSFRDAEKLVKPYPGNPLVLLHSGLLYPTPDRDPTAFFAALARLRQANQISPDTLRIVLRASGSDDHYRALIRKFGIDDLVRLEPIIPYREALAEMMSVHGLLLFQGYTSNPAVPAKLYEYCRARKPILAMVDPGGDTAAVLAAAGTGMIVPMVSSGEIADALVAFIKQIREGKAAIATPEVIRRHSREHKAKELAGLLDQVC